MIHQPQFVSHLPIYNREIPHPESTATDFTEECLTDLRRLIPGKKRMESAGEDRYEIKTRECEKFRERESDFTKVEKDINFVGEIKEKDISSIDSMLTTKKKMGIGALAEKALRDTLIESRIKAGNRLSGQNKETVKRTVLKVDKSKRNLGKFSSIKLKLENIGKDTNLPPNEPSNVKSRSMSDRLGIPRARNEEDERFSANREISSNEKQDSISLSKRSSSIKERLFNSGFKKDESFAKNPNKSSTKSLADLRAERFKSSAPPLRISTNGKQKKRAISPISFDLDKKPDKETPKVISQINKILKTNTDKMSGQNSLGSSLKNRLEDPKLKSSIELQGRRKLNLKKEVKVLDNHSTSEPNAENIYSRRLKLKRSRTNLSDSSVVNPNNSAKKLKISPQKEDNVVNKSEVNHDRESSRRDDESLSNDFSSKFNGSAGDFCPNDTVVDEEELLLGSSSEGEADDVSEFDEADLLS